MIRIFYILLCLFLCSASSPFASENFLIEKLSEGTYVALPKAGGNSVSNSIFVILKKGVLLIDSQASEDLAEELLHQIRKITPKPIIYLVNTHFHSDHTGGNNIFSPNAQMILHHEAYIQLQQAKELSDNPIIFIKYELTIALGKKEIQILWLGKGHTEGDLFIYLPEDQILVLGDLFYNRVIPNVEDGNIKEWLAVLDRIIKLKKFQAIKIVPGHGPVGDFNDLRKFRELLAWSRGVVDTEIKKGTGKGNILQAARETKLYKSRIHLYDHQERLPDLLDKAYQEFTNLNDKASIQK